MKTRVLAVLLAVLIVTALVVGGLGVASAEPNPAIITFESSLAEITVADAESATLTTTLSWRTVGLTSDYRLTLATYIFDRWEMVFPETAVPLEANGAVGVTVRHPLSFSPPTFLLSIVRAGSSSIIAQRVISIPYETPSADPQIDDFVADAENVDMAELQAGTARVNLTWAVGNRAPTTNLVFEQVFEDGETASVELPRPNLWVPSSGEGPVAPVYKEGEDNVVLRLRVIDVLTDEVLDESEIELLITGTGGPVTEPPPAEEPPPASNIVTFTAAPTAANRGAPVTLTWEVQGTGGMVIEQLIPNGGEATAVVNAQSPKGSATVFLPENAAYSVTYTLRTTNPPASMQAVVNVHCPYTFFFGQGEGCPATEVREVSASYQEFEGGYMVWRGDTNEIYVHYDDGSAAYFLEASYAWMDDPALTEFPPLDRLAPESGFGKVWANAPGVRDKLGWAVEAEQGYTLQAQPVATTRVPPPEFSVYFTLPSGEVVGTGYGLWRAMPGIG